MTRRVKDDMDFFLIQIKGGCRAAAASNEKCQLSHTLPSHSLARIGTRRYLMHEDDLSYPKIRQRIQKMLIVDRTFRILLAAFIIYKILMKFNFMGFADYMEERSYANETIVARI